MELSNGKIYLPLKKPLFNKNDIYRVAHDLYEYGGVSIVIFEASNEIFNASFNFTDSKDIGFAVSNRPKSYSGFVNGMGEFDEDFIDPRDLTEYGIYTAYGQVNIKRK